MERIRHTLTTKVLRGNGKNLRDAKMSPADQIDQLTMMVHEAEMQVAAIESSNAALDQKLLQSEKFTKQMEAELTDARKKSAETDKVNEKLQAENKNLRAEDEKLRMENERLANANANAKPILQDRSRNSQNQSQKENLNVASVTVVKPCRACNASSARKAIIATPHTLSMQCLANQCEQLQYHNEDLASRLELREALISQLEERLSKAGAPTEELVNLRKQNDDLQRARSALSQRLRENNDSNKSLRMSGLSNGVLSVEDLMSQLNSAIKQTNTEVTSNREWIDQRTKMLEEMKAKRQARINARAEAKASNKSTPSGLKSSPCSAPSPLLTQTFSHVEMGKMRTAQEQSEGMVEPKQNSSADSPLLAEARVDMMRSHSTLGMDSVLRDRTSSRRSRRVSRRSLESPATSGTTDSASPHRSVSMSPLSAGFRGATSWIRQRS